MARGDAGSLRRAPLQRQAGRAGHGRVTEEGPAQKIFEDKSVECFGRDSSVPQESILDAWGKGRVPRGPALESNLAPQETGRQDADAEEDVQPRGRTQERPTLVSVICGH